jgi:hypothetical protein
LAFLRRGEVADHHKTKFDPGGSQMAQTNEEMDEPYVLTVGALKHFIQALDDDVEILDKQRAGPSVSID